MRITKVAQDASMREVAELAKDLVSQAEQTIHAMGINNTQVVCFFWGIFVYQAIKNYASLKSGARHILDDVRNLMR